MEFAFAAISRDFFFTSLKISYPDPRTLVFARHFKFKSVTLFLLCARVFSPTADILESEKTLGTRLFRAFPKRVGPRILLLESVDYFGTSEHY